MSQPLSRIEAFKKSPPGTSGRDFVETFMRAQRTPPKFDGMARDYLGVKRSRRLH